MSDKRKHVPKYQSWMDYHQRPIRKLLKKHRYEIRDEKPNPIGISEETGRFVREGYITHEDLRSLWLYAIASKSKDIKLRVASGRNGGSWRNRPDLACQFILRPDVTLDLLRKMRSLLDRKFSRIQLFLMSADTEGMSGSRMVEEYEKWHDEVYEEIPRQHHKEDTAKRLLDESRRLAIRAKQTFR